MFLDDDLTASETATKFADELLDAAVAKIDNTFGKGYAKDNPSLVAGYMAVAGANFSTLMSATLKIQNSGDFDDLLDDEVD